MGKPEGLKTRTSAPRRVRMREDSRAVRLEKELFVAVFFVEEENGKPENQQRCGQGRTLGRTYRSLSDPYNTRIFNGLPNCSAIAFTPSSSRASTQSGSSGAVLVVKKGR
jgi:hypothetical protein